MAGGVYEYTRKGPRGGTQVIGYRITWTGPDGRIKEKKLRGASLAHAKELREELAARARLEGLGARIAADRTTVREWAETFFATRDRLREATIAHQWSIYENHIRRQLGPIVLSKLDPPTVRAWLASLTMTQGRGAKARRVKASAAVQVNAEKVLTVMVRQAAADGLFGPQFQGPAVGAFRKPWHGTKPAKPARRGRPSIASADEFRRVLEVAHVVGGRRLGVACMLAVHCGHRRGELPVLAWDENVAFLDASGSVLREPHAWGNAVRVRVLVPGEHAKDHEDRIMEIRDAGAVRYLVAYRCERPLARWVFEAEHALRARGVVIAEAGRALRSVVYDYQWKRIVAEARLHPAFRFHDLRGSFAKALLRGGDGRPGLDLMQVARLMGHSSIETTRGYLLEVQAPDVVAAGAVFQGWSPADGAELAPATPRDAVPLRTNLAHPGKESPRGVARGEKGRGLAVAPTGDPWGELLRQARVRARVSQDALGEVLSRELPAFGFKPRAWGQRLSKLERGTWRPKDHERASIGAVLARELSEPRLRFVPAKSAGGAHGVA